MNHSSLTGAAAFIALAGIATSQQPGPAAKQGSQDKAAAIKQSLAQNQTALRQYTWTETTQISLKGEVKKQEQKQCRYGPDGKVQKTPMQADAPSQPPAQAGGRRGGRVKKAVVEKKVGELKEYMERVATLVHQYVPPDPQRIQAAQSAGNLSIQPLPNQVASIGIKNYLKPGDSVALGLDSSTNKIRSYGVQSYVENPKNDPVKLAVTFATLPDGTNYAQQIVLDATGKQVQVKVTNSGYAKTVQ
jgi:hypothetical protein